MTLPVTKPLKLQKSTALTCLVIGCEVVPTLLLQYAPYYCSTRHIMAKICLFTTVPTLLQQHQLQYCECHRFNCRQHPYYLNIILISTNQALLLAPLTHAKGIQLTYINHPSCIKLCYYQFLQIQNKSLQLSCLLQHPGSLSFNVFLPARC